MLLKSGHAIPAKAGMTLPLTSHNAQPPTESPSHLQMQVRSPTPVSPVIQAQYV